MQSYYEVFCFQSPRSPQNQHDLPEKVPNKSKILSVVIFTYPLAQEKFKILNKSSLIKGARSLDLREFREIDRCYLSEKRSLSSDPQCKTSCYAVAVLHDE
ncbi:MAG: hypothetical protein AAGA60_22695 [Cyanobacteria bacterium P01_E01_bin.42]